VVRRLTYTFDFITIARSDNDLDPDYGDYLVAFLAAGCRDKASYDSLASFIAFSILMDAPPPGNAW
jgi:hypothetical protein